MVYITRPDGSQYWEYVPEPKPKPNRKCLKCGYAWHTESKHTLPTCPSCRLLKTIPITEDNDRKDTAITNKIDDNKKEEEEKILPPIAGI